MKDRRKKITILLINCFHVSFIGHISHFLSCSFSSSSLISVIASNLFEFCERIFNNLDASLKSATDLEAISCWSMKGICIDQKKLIINIFIAGNMNFIKIPDFRIQYYLEIIHCSKDETNSVFAFLRCSKHDRC